MYTTQFDPLFISAAATYLQDWNGQAWLWLKSEAIAESNLDPSVTAADGGMGLMQFMDATWTQVCGELGLDTNTVSPYQPKYAIPAGAYYLSSLWQKWSAPRPKFDRMQLTQAAYNCGFGNMLRAQRLSGMKNDYESIIAQLHNVTDDANARITQNYVRRIHDIYVELTRGTQA
jgi:soluble lytic murein transglycosylase-like protein